MYNKCYSSRVGFLLRLMLIGTFVPFLLHASCQNNAITLPQLASSASFVATLALFIGVLLGWVALFSYVLKQLFGFPEVASAILGGIVLGPSGFSIATMPYINGMTQLIGGDGNMVIIPYYDCFIFFLCLVSALFTVSYLLWMAGYETEISEMKKVGYIAALAGILGAFLPIVFIVGSMPLFILMSDWSLVQFLGLGLVLAATSVSIPVAMLFEAKKMHLRSSKATLAAAVIDDIVAVVLLSGFFVFLQQGFVPLPNAVVLPCHGMGIVSVMQWLLGSVMLLCFFGFFVLPWLIRLAGQYHVASVGLIATLSMLFYFATAELLGGLAGITGAYFAGLFYRLAEQGRGEHEVRKIIIPFVEAIFVPLFLVTVGLQVDIRILSLSEWMLVGAVSLVAIISKMVACFFATSCLTVSRDQKWYLIERYLFGAAMVARGEVGLVVATMLQGANLITSVQYVVMVVVVIATTLIAPFMLYVGFRYYNTDLPGDTNEQFIMVIAVLNEVVALELFSVIMRHIATLGYHSVEMHTGDVVISGMSLSREVRFSMRTTKLEMNGYKHDVNILSKQLKEGIKNEWSWLFSA